jgi:hypothetical protein
VGYDVVAHYAGVRARTRSPCCATSTRRVAQVERAARRAGRAYQFVVLSDHGQSAGAPFRQRYGATLEAVVRTLVRGDVAVAASVGSDEVSGHVQALLAELRPRRRRAGVAGVGPDAGRRHPRGGDEAGDTPATGGRRGGREAGDERARAGVVVCASGNLGLIYLARLPGRATLEAITAAYPELVDGLVRHPGVGFVLARSAEHGAIAIGRTACTT